MTVKKKLEMVEALAAAEIATKFLGQRGEITSNPIDSLIKQAVSETDTAKAVQLANQADKLLFTEVHTLTLFQRPQMCGVTNGLANLGSFGFANIDYTKIGYMK